MAGIQFISGAPALDQFNARVSAGDQARRQEEQDFRQRFLLERQQGTDRALREAALADIDARGASMPPALPVAQPRGPSMPPAVAPPAGAPGSVPAVQAPNQALDALAVPAETMRNEQSRITAADVVAPGAGMPTESTAQTSPVALPVARQRPSAGGTSDAMVRRLAQTPGTGETLMRMYQADRTDRRAQVTAERQTHMDGIKLFSEAAKAGDVATMRAVSQRYDLGIPPEVLNRREIMAEIAAGTNTAKAYGITDDERAIAFGLAYTEATATGADPRRALQAGFAAAQKAQKAGAGFKPKHWFVGADGTVQAAGEDMSVRSTGSKARPPQPPFALSGTAEDQRGQALMNTAFDNAVRGAGRMWSVMSQQQQDDAVAREVARLRSKGQAAPVQTAPAAAAPANDPLGLRAR